MIGKNNIAYLPTARRRCACGHVRAVADACARRDPKYRAIAVLDCGECGSKIENPFEGGGFEDYRPEDAPDPDPQPVDMSIYRPPGTRKRVPPGARFYDTPTPVCAECGQVEDKNNPLYYIEFRDDEGPFWEWWCLPCQAALEATLP